MSSSLTNSARHYIKANLRRMEDLPEPGREWLAGREDVKNAYLEGMAKRGIIHKEKKVTIPKGRGRNVWMYSTDKRSYEVIQEFIHYRDNTDGFLPCNHDRFKTKAEGIECKSCDKLWSKEEVKAHNS